MDTKKREYFRIYMLKRYHERRNLAIKFLGSKCIKCGSPENLELDHKDRKTKSYEIAKLWNKPLKKFWEEVKKCQLLCKKHHGEKSLVERGLKSAKGEHGNLSNYRYCGPPKCELCKKVKRDFARENPSPSRLNRVHNLVVK